MRTILFSFIAVCLMLTSCTSKNVLVTENYTETEYRQEAFQSIEQYEIKTPTIVPLYAIDPLSGETTLLFKKQDDKTICWARMTLGTDFPQIDRIVLKETEKNPRIVIKADAGRGACLYNRGRQSADFALIQYNVTYIERQFVNPMYSYGVFNIENMPACQGASGKSALNETFYVMYKKGEPAQSLSLEQADSVILNMSLGYGGVKSTSCFDSPYNAEFTINDLFKYENWALLDIYSGPATVAYVWDTVQAGTREVTKYRDVPYQVEKQRIVTKSMDVPFWEAILSK
jgi:hypothetical protein